MRIRKRIITAILFAYPAAWRREYGPELTDLLLRTNLGPRTIANVFRRGLEQRACGMHVGRIWSRACVVLCLVFFLASGCRPLRNLFPHTHTTATSPDGQYTAFVRSGALNLDPPDDHLYLASPGRPARYLMGLGADMAWSRTIVWARDSRRVGFVINDDRIAVFDATTGDMEAMFFLIGRGECCGGPEAAKRVRFSDDGAGVQFDHVRPATVLIKRRDGQTIEAPVTAAWEEHAVGLPRHTPEIVLEHKSMAVPSKRIRLRLEPPSATTRRVNVVDQQKRWLSVPLTERAGGVLELPAVSDLPIDRLEVARVVVRDVRMDGTPVIVPLR
jgi:hypothetical protein